MIHIVKVLCSICHKPYNVFINDNQLIKLPYVCVNCFSKKESEKIRYKEYRIGHGGVIKDVTFLLGYQRNRKKYKPIILKSDIEYTPLNCLFSEN